EHLPREGGFIAAGNHLTNLDALVFAHFLYDHGAAPRFLAKHTLFGVPLLGWALRQTEQIPVHRNTSAARESLEPAREALRRGLCRLALTARVPVVPIALWGVQDVLARYGKVPHLVPRRTVRVQAGPPVPLDDLYDRTGDPQAQREATDRVMAAITGMLAEMRAEQPPARPYDIRRAGHPRAAEPGARRRRQQTPRTARARRRRSAPADGSPGSA